MPPIDISSNLMFIINIFVAFAAVFFTYGIAVRIAFMSLDISKLTADRFTTNRHSIIVFLGFALYFFVGIIPFYILDDSSLYSLMMLVLTLPVALPILGTLPNKHPKLQPQGLSILLTVIKVSTIVYIAAIICYTYIAYLNDKYTPEDFYTPESTSEDSGTKISPQYYLSPEVSFSATLPVGYINSVEESSITFFHPDHFNATTEFFASNSSDEVIITIFTEDAADLSHQLNSPAQYISFVEELHPEAELITLDDELAVKYETDLAPEFKYQMQTYGIEPPLGKVYKLVTVKSMHYGVPITIDFKFYNEQSAKKVMNEFLESFTF